MMQFWLVDEDGTLLNLPSHGGSLLPDVPGLPVNTQCTNSALKQRGYRCNNLHPRLFNWESLDHDCCAWDRRELGAFKYTRKSDGHVHLSKHMSDDSKCCLGCEFGHSYYPFVFMPGNTYTIVIPSSMPEKSLIHFFSRDRNEFVVIKIFYNTSLKVRPYIRGRWVKNLENVQATKNAGPTTPHGTHMQNPQENFFTIVMKGDRNWNNVKKGITLQTVAVVQISVTMSMTVEKFDTQKQTAFINNMATLLGIDPLTVKIVSVAAARRRTTANMHLSNRFLQPSNSTDNSGFGRFLEYQNQGGQASGIDIKFDIEEDKPELSEAEADVGTTETISAGALSTDASITQGSSVALNTTSGAEVAAPACNTNDGSDCEVDNLTDEQTDYVSGSCSGAKVVECFYDANNAWCDACVNTDGDCANDVVCATAGCVRYTGSAVAGTCDKKQIAVGAVPLTPVQKKAAADAQVLKTQELSDTITKLEEASKSETPGASPLETALAEIAPVAALPLAVIDGEKKPLEDAARLVNATVQAVESSTKEIKTCTVVNGETKCVCDPGYFGQICESKCACKSDDENALATDKNVGVERCNDGNTGDGTCMCNQRYSGSKCLHCNYDKASKDGWSGPNCDHLCKNGDWSPSLEKPGGVDYQT